LRKWTVRQLEWTLTDQKKIELWRKGKDKSIPKDAKVLAQVVVFRNDTERSTVIVQIGTATCGARFLPWKDDEGSYTTIHIFFVPNKPAKGDPPLGCRSHVSMAEKELATGIPIILGSTAHGVVHPKGGYKSYRIRATTVTVNDIDVNGVDKVVDAFTGRSILP